MRWLISLWILLAGCVDAHGGVEDAQPTRAAVLVAEQLSPVGPALDPLWEHRPPDVDCPPATWGAEAGAFEVQTGACAYAAFDQPLPVDIRAGDELEITVWHDLLDAAEPGNGHVAVWLGETVLWEAEVHVPAASNTLSGRVRIAETPGPGARLGLHLHNHGFNSWRFVAIDRIR